LKVFGGLPATKVWKVKISLPACPTGRQGWSCSH